LPHTGACGHSGQQAPILSTAYYEIKQKIRRTRLVSMTRDDWTYRGAVSGAVVAVLLVYLFDLVVVFWYEPQTPIADQVGMVLTLVLFTTLPAILVGGLAGVMVAIIGFALSRPSFPARSSSLDCFEQENEATSQRPRLPPQGE
jgi:hypothetical protein